MRTLIASLVFISSISLSANDSENDPQTREDKAIDRLKALNGMREGLAASLNDSREPITEDTFKKVCMPVGKNFMEWGKDNGYQVRQIAVKNRNPQNAPRPEEVDIFQEFEKNSSLMHKVVAASKEKGEGTLLYVRIPTVQACLHCHGPKDERPEFVKVKYQNDKAYDFKPGDLRGLYAVFIPKVTKD